MCAVLQRSRVAVPWVGTHCGSKLQVLTLARGGACGNPKLTEVWLTQKLFLDLRTVLLARRSELCREMIALGATQPGPLFTFCAQRTIAWERVSWSDSAVAKRKRGGAGCGRAPFHLAENP